MCHCCENPELFRPFATICCLLFMGNQAPNTAPNRGFKLGTGLEARTSAEERPCFMRASIDSRSAMGAQPFAGRGRQGILSKSNPQGHQQARPLL